MSYDSSPLLGPESLFAKTLEELAAKKKSRIVMALDLPPRRDTADDLLDRAEHLLEATAQYLCAVKMNFHLLLPLSFSEIKQLNERASSFGLLSIADIKLNDIGHTNEVTTDYLWSADFDGVIVNPLAGFEDGLDVVFRNARAKGKGVITLAFMSHKGAAEGYGLSLSQGGTIFELFLQRANEWQADGVIVGSTQPERITSAKAKLRKGTKILCPGSGAQGGDPLAALHAGADYLIYGRGIVEQPDPKEAARKLYELLLPWSASR